MFFTIITDYSLPKLWRYVLKEYDKEINVNSDSNVVKITDKDGSEIIIYDNKYLTVGNKNYEIVSGSVNLEKFYTFID